jgi:GDPmannose 4,6-dehydratase
MKALLFGINGQDGFYLSDLLLQKGVEVIGVSRSAGHWVKGDVGDREFTTRLIKKEKPDYVFHLAANSRTHYSLLYEHQSTIANGTINILQAVAEFCSESKVFITGSGLQFKNNGLPVNEETPFEANDVYSLARIQSVFAARYFRSRGLNVYIGYLFHHDSPHRTVDHLNRKIADAAIAASMGNQVQLSIGDISVEKEFAFAGDIAEGIFHLVNQDNLSEACIGTGKAYTIEKWLDLCFSSFNKNWRDFVTINTDFKPDFQRLVSNPQKINLSGWKPATGIDELAKLMLRSA